MDLLLREVLSQTPFAFLVIVGLAVILVKLKELDRKIEEVKGQVSRHFDWHLNNDYNQNKKRR